MSNNSIFIEKLRSSGLRPTKQRIQICKLLFDRKDTFHFTINDLTNSLKKLSAEKISLATIYNTIHAFKDKGYLKEISINSDKSYFDTNVSNHHHFYDSENSELIDIDANEVVIQKLPKAPNGKKIKNVEVFINLKN